MNAKSRALSMKKKDPYGLSKHAKMFASKEHKEAVAKGKASHINRRKFEPED